MIKKVELPGSFVQDRAGTMLAHRPTSRTIGIIDSTTLRELATFESSVGKPLEQWALSPDGVFLASEEADKCIHLWDLRAIRARLAELGLDFDAPPLSAEAPSRPLIVTVEGDGSPAARTSNKDQTTRSSGSK